MHSLKNTFVAITLLAISFGLYQVSLTPDVDVDPGETPAVEISDGMDALASLDAGQSRLAPPASVQDLASADSRPKVQGFPDFPEINITQPDLVTDNPPIDKQPLTTSSQNNVQTIEYPTSIANQDFPREKSESTPEVTQRALVDPSMDQGLIDVLKDQQDFEATMNPANEFPSEPVASQPAKPREETLDSPSMTAETGAGSRPTVADGATSGFGDEQSFGAQPIATNDSTYNELASNVATPDGDSASFDPRVAQADLESDFSQLEFDAAWPKVDELVEAGDFHAALKLLSRFYRDDQLTGPQRQRLLGWLDALAGKVIFSDEHHLVTEPYIVQGNESLTDIAGRWNIPAQLIYNVNQQVIPNPVTVNPGTALKMIPGPFHAEVSLNAKVMTLFLGDLYAGRFPIRVGISGQPRPGDFKVIVKSESGHTWRDSKGVDYPPGSPENGYGPSWLGLTGSLCIHEVDASARDGHNGCIGLDRKDAKDVFAILAEKSDVKILR